MRYRCCPACLLLGHKTPQRLIPDQLLNITCYFTNLTVVVNDTEHWVVGKGGYGRTRTRTRTRTWTQKFSKGLLHLYNSYFSYLTLYLQQSSPPDPGVDLFIALIHL